ncbi:MAG: 4-hydroxy-tetrahydrodipicolinate synthase [Acutalibacteraceae bacterium]|nr:4-hydroxy-tetrahydrodipicolinate synthase [Acutalibacteraceae bacterium]
MKTKIFSGAATALITPMNQDGSVNYGRLETLVNTQIESGIDSLVICGTTGEKSTLRYDEHLKVIEVAAKSANKRIPIIAGTGSNDTVYSVELCNDAEKMGADAFLMVTPYYNKTSQAGLIAHYNYIADRVKKPIILYNVPSRTGVDIEPETYKELSKHPNIIATKEASGNISKIAKTKYLCGDDLDIYSGNDDQIVPILSLGGIGVISVLSNILPLETHNICAEYLKGNTKTASEMQIKYTGLINTLFSDVNPVPIKTAMNLLGYDVGPCRLPLYKMDKAKTEKLKQMLKELKLLDVK